MSDPRRSVRRMLEAGLAELKELRGKYGPHRDFDLVETHQRRLLDAFALDLRSDERPEDRLQESA